jgi:hypothetical protein
MYKLEELPHAVRFPLLEHGVHRDVRFAAQLVERLHGCLGLTVREVAAPPARVEVVQAEVDSVRAFGYCRVESLGVPGRGQEFRNYHKRRISI